MCYVTWDNEASDGPSGPLPRPFPLLAWAVPVDIAQLGAGLEAYSNMQPTVVVIRLGHRFGSDPLSTLPQEILEQILSSLLQAERDGFHDEWEDNFACFQERCTPSQHYTVGTEDTERAFRYAYHAITDHGTSTTSEADYDDYDKLDLVQCHYDENPEAWEEEERWITHENQKRAWLNRACVCKKKGTANAKETKFTRLNEMLKLHFGLEAVIYHEHLGYRFMDSVAVLSNRPADAYYTSSFLVPSSMAPKRPAQEVNDSVYSHQQFIDPNSQSAFRQVIEPASLILTNKLKAGFARAMRVLDLQPHYHLSQLEPLFIPVIQDPSFKKMCCCSRTACPCDKDIEFYEKFENLMKYLREKEQELATQSWPQLMMVSPSQAVCPNSHPHW